MKFLGENIWMKYAFVLVAALIAIGSLLVSNLLVKELKEEENKKIQIWAEATKELTSSEEDISLELILKILESNTTIPVILHDKASDYYHSTNINIESSNEQAFLKEQSTKFIQKHEPILIEVRDIIQYVYYDDSYILKRLQLYPYVQLGVVAIFMIVSLLAVLSTKRMEQDRVWVGLSKETAHQLGTPISSLLAWVEYMKLQSLDDELVDNMEKDVNRLRMVGDRFSKIGSKEVLEIHDLREIIETTIHYLQFRISPKVNIDLELSKEPVLANVNAPLISWVIENLAKNAVDAMDGVGEISIKLKKENNCIAISIFDTGKGIAKSKFKTIFNPGYTSKQRGWGLGLSLAKRIIQSYHKGKIYVESSQIDIGTTFRIELQNLKDAKTDES